MQYSITYAKKSKSSSKICQLIINFSMICILNSFHGLFDFIIYSKERSLHATTTCLLYIKVTKVTLVLRYQLISLKHVSKDFTCNLLRQQDFLDFLSCVIFAIKDISSE